LKAALAWTIPKAMSWRNKRRTEFMLAFAASERYGEDVKRNGNGVHAYSEC
jgi:hypothetical protein